MPTHSETERRVAEFLAERAAHHDEMAARWRRLFELLFKAKPTTLVPGDAIQGPSAPDAFIP